MRKQFASFLSFPRRVHPSAFNLSKKYTLTNVPSHVRTCRSLRPNAAASGKRCLRARRANATIPDGRPRARQRNQPCMRSPVSDRVFFFFCVLYLGVYVVPVGRRTSPHRRSPLRMVNHTYTTHHHHQHTHTRAHNTRARTCDPLVCTPDCA